MNNPCLCITSNLQPTLLTLEPFIKRIIRIPILTLRLIERVAIIFHQIHTILHLPHQIRIADKIPPKNDRHFFVAVLLVHRPDGRIGFEATRNQDRAGLVPGLDGEVDFLGGLDVGVAGDAGLDNVEVGEFEGFEVLNVVRELGDGVGHFHALEGAEGGEADADFVSADGGDDGLGDFEAEARAVGDAAAVAVSAVVAGVLEELVDQVAVGGMDFDAVEAGRDAVFGGLGVQGDEFFDLGFGHGLGCGRAFFFGDVARGAEGVGAAGHGFEDVWVGDAAEGPELEVDVAAFGVDGVGDAFPGGDLIVVPDSWDVGVAGGLGRNEGCFANKEGARDGGALSVVFFNKGEGHVLVVCSEAR